MAMLKPSTQVAPGVLVNLGTTDSVTVRKHVLIGSTDNYAISGNGSSQSAQIAGTVYSGYIAILIGSITSTGNSVTVAETGTVHADFAAVLCYGADVSVTVDGLVHGGSYGVVLYGKSENTTSTVINRGTISANSAVARDGSGTTESVKLLNFGMIEGTTMSYGILTGTHDARDLIINKGTMVGKILLDAGNDRYDGSKGRVDGDVKGGQGNDTLSGGKENNVLLGDTGFDELTGGLGADELTGGADRDQFIYKSVKDSSISPTGRDTIMDFSQIEADQINLRTIDANTQASGDQKFDFIGQSAFHGKAGELRYSIIDGHTLVQGDVNGDKKADFAVLIDPEISLGAGDFIL